MEAELSIFEYIEVCYNRKRIHSSLGYLTSIKFEKIHTRKREVA